MKMKISKTKKTITDLNPWEARKFLLQNGVIRSTSSTTYLFDKDDRRWIWTAKGSYNYVGLYDGLYYALSSEISKLEDGDAV